MNYEYQYSNTITLDWLIEHMPQFLFPDLSRKKGRIQKAFSGVLASSNQHPVGLILSTYDQTGTTARIHSFWVHPTHRNRGIGKKLLAELEFTLAQEGCKEIDGHFRSHWKSLPVLKKILEAQAWEKPEEDLIILKGETPKALMAFVANDSPLPDAYTLGTWDQLSGEKIALIKQKKKEENWYPDMLDPFVYEETMNPNGSLYLEYEGNVVGWVVSNIISPGLNEFISLFIDEAHRSFKLTHRLIRSAIVQLIEAGTPHYLITVKPDNRVMSRFLLRNGPAADCIITHSFRTWKKLKSVASP